jgi:hypothetical protein
MAYERSLHGVIPGLLLLALLWATWAGYPWLGMDARASGNGSLETGSQGDKVHRMAQVVRYCPP